MIFVTLGSQKFQFNRLLRALDELAEKGAFAEEIFAQTGYSDYRPRHYRFQPFLDAEEFTRCLEKADLVITHAGTGVIISAVKRGRRVIVVPRLGRYGEHVDDHQVQIAEMFSELGYVCACEDCGQLAEKIREAKGLRFEPYVSNTEKYVASLEEYIQSL